MASTAVTVATKLRARAHLTERRLERAVDAYTGEVPLRDLDVVRTALELDVAAADELERLLELERQVGADVAEAVRVAATRRAVDVARARASLEYLERVVGASPQRWLERLARHEAHERGNHDNAAAIELVAQLLDELVALLDREPAP